MKQAVAPKSPLIHYLLPLCIITIITIITYYPSLRYNFQFDDIANIQKHFDIRHYQFKDMFFSGSRWISYWLNAVHYGIGKFDPFSYRVGNLIIHLTNGLLLFFVLLFALQHYKQHTFFKRNSYYITIITTLLFLLHPVQTQTVSYVIQGQLEGLACFFILLMLITFLQFCYSTSIVKQRLLFCALFIIAAIACGTKEIAFISPFLVMLVDWFFVAHGSLKSFKKRIWLHATLFCVITSIYLYFLKPSFFSNILLFKMKAANNIGNVITEQASQPIEPWGFFISQFKVIIHYLTIFIWPFNISVEYNWVLSRSFFAYDCILPLIVLVAIGCMIIRKLLKDPTCLFCFGALWFFCCITPRSSIIPSPELLVDYKTYIASIGWLFIIACGIIKTFEYTIQHYNTASKESLNALLHNQQISSIILLCLSLPLGFTTWQRNKIWSSGSNFWMDVIKHAPKARAYNNYAVELAMVEHRYEEAIPYFKKAIQKDPFYPDPHNNLAVCYTQLGHNEQAIAALERSLQLCKYYPEGWNNLASLYLEKKEFDKVRECLNKALALREHYGKAYLNYGRLYLALGKAKEALVYFKKACTTADLDNELGFKVYGQVAMHEKEYSEAIWALQKTLEYNQNDRESRFVLANCYYLSADYSSAIYHYQLVVQSDPNNIRVLYNLGEAYLATNDIVNALCYFNKVMPQWQDVPQVRIQLANCYEKLNDPLKAHAELIALFKTSTAPAQLRIKAKELLLALEEGYPSVKAATLIG